jgi:DNA polymerase I
MLEDPATLKIGHNMKFDVQQFARRGITIAPIDDTRLISYALESGLTAHNMGDLSERHIGHRPISFKEVAGSGRSGVTFDLVPIDKATPYAAEDADVTLRLWHVLKSRLLAERKVTVYETLERPLVGVLADMERHGITVDRAVLSRLSGEFAQSAGALESEIWELAGGRFNIGSTKQLGEVLFGRLGLPGGRKTATGAWSTDSDVLDVMAAQGRADRRQDPPVAPAHQAQVDLYRRPAPPHQCRDRPRPHLLRARRHLHRPPRLHRAQSAEHPDPHRGGPQDQAGLRGARRRGADLGRLQPDRAARARPRRRHPPAQARLRGQPRHPRHDRVGNVRRADRGHGPQRAPPGESDQLRHHLRHLRLRPRQPARHSARRSEHYIRTYFERFPGIRDYMDSTRRFAREHGYVETVFGRRCHFPRITASNPSERANQERAAINAPIQGAAADVIRRAMVRMPAALAEAGFKAKMLLQVHDELVFEADESEAANVMALAIKVMEPPPTPPSPCRSPSRSKPAPPRTGKRPTDPPHLSLPGSSRQSMITESDVLPRKPRPAMPDTLRKSPPPCPRASACAPSSAKNPTAPARPSGSPRAAPAPSTSTSSPP